jgi:hypothetical protein
MIFKARKIGSANNLSYPKTAAEITAVLSPCYRCGRCEISQKKSVLIGKKSLFIQELPLSRRRSKQVRKEGLPAK